MFISWEAAYIAAVGKATLALWARISGGDAPPNINVSSAWPLLELSIRSETIEGTLYKHYSITGRILKNSHLPACNANIFLPDEPVAAIV